MTWRAKAVEYLEKRAEATEDDAEADALLAAAEDLDRTESVFAELRASVRAEERLTRAFAWLRWW